MSFTSTTVNSAQAFRPDVNVFAPEDVLDRAVIFAASTVSSRIEGDEPALRVGYIDDDNAEFVDEGAKIDEAQPDLKEAVVHTRKFAQLVRMSREQFSQQGTPDQLAISVKKAMTDKADNAFLAQAKPSGDDKAPVPGLANTDGILSKDDVTDNLDDLIDLVAEVQTNRGQPDLWVVSPDCWAGLRKMHDEDGSNRGILGDAADAAEPRLLSLPVRVNRELPSKTGLLIDRSAIVSAVSDLTIATSADMYFSSDSIAIRATMRTGHAVPRKDRIGVFALEGADESA